MTLPPRTVAIVQPNYIPWKGYFDLIRRADLFVLYDDAQYTVRDWRNRNRIKTKDGPQWLSIPIDVHGRREQRIRDARVADPAWAERHWKALASAYARAPQFPVYREQLEALYRGTETPWLSEINRRFIDRICGWLNIGTRIVSSTDFTLAAGKSERLLDICRQAGATTYLSGPAARAYLDLELFAAAGVAVSFMHYPRYPEYPQVHPPFEHAVTAIDLVLHAGPDAPRYLEAATA